VAEKFHEDRQADSRSKHFGSKRMATMPHAA